MRKNDTTDNIDTLCEEYKNKQTQRKAHIESIEKKIAECDKTIDKLNLDISKDISSITPEKYISIHTELDKAKLTREVYEKQLSSVRDSLSGFDTESEKNNFKKRLMAVYRNDETEFTRECDKHIKALDILLRQRNEILEKTQTLGQQIGEYGVLQPSNVRQLVSRTVSARINSGAYTN